MANSEDEQDFLTRREAEILIKAGIAAEAARLDSYRREQTDLREALALAWNMHDKTHVFAEEAVKTALVSVANERNIHAEAHEREHAGHLEIHKLANLAIEKADAANDKRFDSANGYRQIFEARMSETASTESLHALQKEYDRRIQALEQNDTKAESLKRGQGTVIAYIVTAVGVLGTLVVMMNLLLAR